jgi:hypothetical protein
MLGCFQIEKHMAIGKKCLVDGSEKLLTRVALSDWKDFLFFLFLMFQWNRLPDCLDNLCTYLSSRNEYSYQV